MNDKLTVNFYAVDRQLPAMECDSLRVPVSDSVNGDFSGYYGIRKGHTRAIISLKNGDVTINEGGKTIFTAEISDGFALVENNVVSITVDSVKEKN